MVLKRNAFLDVIGAGKYSYSDQTIVTRLTFDISDLVNSSSTSMKQYHLYPIGYTTKGSDATVQFTLTTLHSTRNM